MDDVAVREPVRAGYDGLARPDGAERHSFFGEPRSGVTLAAEPARFTGGTASLPRRIEQANLVLQLPALPAAPSPPSSWAAAFWEPLARQVPSSSPTC